MPNPPILSLADLLARKLPEREWIVDDVIPRGSLSLLAGREKAGKTLFANDLASSVALDEPFVDRAVMAGPVVFIVAEENIREVRDRIMARLNGRSDAGIYVLQADGTHDGYELRIDTPDGIADVVEVVQRCEPVLMVFDPLRELHSGLEDRSDDMSPIIRPLRSIAHDTDTAIVLIHHASRSGDSRGSTAIGGAVDQKMRFDRIGDEDDDTLRARVVTQGRYGPRVTLHARLGECLRWTPDTPVITLPDETARTRILAVVETHGEPLTAQEIAARIDSQSVKTVQNKLSDMMRESTPPLVASGTGRKHDPKRYALAEPTLFDRAEMVPDPPAYRGTGRKEPFPSLLPEASGNKGTTNGKHASPAPSRTCENCGQPRTRGMPCQHCGLSVHQARAAAGVAP